MQTEIEMVKSVFAINSKSKESLESSGLFKDIQVDSLLFIFGTNHMNNECPLFEDLFFLSNPIRDTNLIPLSNSTKDLSYVNLYSRSWLRYKRFISLQNLHKNLKLVTYVTILYNLANT